MTQVPPIARSSFDGLDLNDIVIFARVVQHGSFTSAAKLFGKSPSYMSKHITQLENTLALTLLHRSTHRVFLTDVGNVFFDHCVRILTELEAAKANAGALSSELVGTLRIHSTPGVGQALVVPAIADFNAKFPTVKVELTFSVYSANLMERGVDVVIGSRDFDHDEFFHSGLFERKLGTVPYVVCAAPAYFARYPKPSKPEELSGHNCLIHVKQRGNPRLWKISVENEETVVPVDGMFQSNLESAIRIAALQGSGIARLPHYSVAEEIRAGTLVPIFDGGIASDRTIKAFYPRSRFVPRKVYEFLSIVEERLKSSAR
ncbi:LysR family transcriptional regulator [Rhizobium binxianense]